MTVAELRRWLSAYEDDAMVFVQGPHDEVWLPHECLGENEQGDVIVMAKSAATADAEKGER